MYDAVNSLLLEEKRLLRCRKKVITVVINFHAKSRLSGVVNDSNRNQWLHLVSANRALKSSLESVVGVIGIRVVRTGRGHPGVYRLLGHS